MATVPSVAVASLCFVGAMFVLSGAILELGFLYRGRAEQNPVQSGDREDCFVGNCILPIVLLLVAKKMLERLSAKIPSDPTMLA